MTLARKAYQALRWDIVRGAYEPDQPLRMAQLRDRYGMGFSPLREALTRLQAERLVVSEALRGFRVAPLSLSEMRDTTDTRILIETEALRKAIATGGDDWETGIVAALHALQLQAGRAEPSDEAQLQKLEARHYEFHRALIIGCASRTLLDIFETLYVESERYRNPIISAPTSHSKRDLKAEHAAIAEATLRRDADGATELLRAHYTRTAEMIEALAAEGGKPVLAASG